MVEVDVKVSANFLLPPRHLNVRLFHTYKLDCFSPLTSSFEVIVEMDRLARTPVKKPPRLQRVAAKIAGAATPSARRTRPPTPRRKGADIKTPDRWRIVSAYLELCRGRDRLPRGAMSKLKSRFPHLQLSSRGIQKIVELFKRQAQDNQTAGNVRLTRRRTSLCGGQNMILTDEIALKIK